MIYINVRNVFINKLVHRVIFRPVASFFLENHTFLSGIAQYLLKKKKSKLSLLFPWRKSHKWCVSLRIIFLANEKPYDENIGR